MFPNHLSFVPCSISFVIMPFIRFFVDPCQSNCIYVLWNRKCISHAHTHTSRSNGIGVIFFSSDACLCAIFKDCKRRYINIIKATSENGVNFLLWRRQEKPKHFRCSWNSDMRCAFLRCPRILFVHQNEPHQILPKIIFRYTILIQSFTIKYLHAWQRCRRQGTGTQQHFKQRKKKKFMKIYWCQEIRQAYKTKTDIKTSANTKKQPTISHIAVRRTMKKHSANLTKIISVFFFLHFSANCNNAHLPLTIMLKWRFKVIASMHVMIFVNFSICFLAVVVPWCLDFGCCSFSVPKKKNKAKETHFTEKMGFFFIFHSLCTTVLGLLFKSRTNVYTWLHNYTCAIRRSYNT